MVIDAQPQTKHPRLEFLSNGQPLWLEFYTSWPATEDLKQILPKTGFPFVFEFLAYGASLCPNFSLRILSPGILVLP